MDFLKNKKLIPVAAVLLLAFLLETPLRNYIIPGVSLIPAVNRILATTIGYFAIFVSVLFVAKSYMNKANLIKAAVIIGGYMVTERLLYLILFGETLTLIYQLGRPLVAVTVIYFALKLITNCRYYKHVKVYTMGAILLGGNAAFNIAQYVSMILARQNAGNDFFALVSMLTPTTSVYTILASLCSYAIIFLSFAFAQKCIDDDFYVV